MRRIPPWKLIAIALAVIALASGCVSTKTILIPPGEPVQLAEDVDARVYVELPDGTRVKSDNRVTLHEGQWVVSDVEDQEPP